jgi:branched-chain amino acid transport system substrate-binding protein
MGKINKSFLLLFVFFVSIIIVGGCTKKSDDKNIIIPAILPLTGPSADLGQSVANGMKLAAEDLNKEFPQYKFELSIEDSKGQPKEAVTIFNSLTTKTTSPVILSWMSSAAKALYPLAANNKRVLFVGAAMPDLTQGKDFVIRVFPNATDLADKLASYASKRYKTCSILYVADDYGNTIKDVFKNKFEKEGGRIKLMEPLNLGETDFRTILLKVKKNPTEAVYIPAYGPIYVHIFQQIRELLPNIAIIADIPLFNTYTLEQIGNVANGIVGAATIVDDETTTIPQAKDFIKRYKERYNKRADFNAGLGYDMYKVAAIGVMNEKGDGTAVINYIKNQKNFKGVTGDVLIDSDGDSKIQLELMEIKNGWPVRKPGD